MRSVPAWIGSHDDQAIPARVKLRIFERQGGKCAGCDRKCTSPEFDHIVPLCMGGRHAETNLQALCSTCHRLKTANDVKAKAKSARIRLKEAGIRPRQSRPIPGSKASGWRKPMNGPAERRT